jgi:TolA-binding protein
MAQHQAVKFSEDPAEWFRIHQRRVAQVGTTVVVIGVAAWFTWSWQARKNAAAAAALDLARNVAQSNNLAAAAGQFQQIIERYRGTDAANQAVIALNQVRMINGQYELAAANLRDYVKSGPQPHYAAAAGGLLGSALESSGHFGDAGAAYLAASRAADVDYLRADYLLKAGKAYASAGDTSAASAALDSVVVAYKSTPVYTEAAIRLAELTQGRLPKGSDAVARLPQASY